MFLLFNFKRILYEFLLVLREHIKATSYFSLK